MDHDITACLIQLGFRAEELGEINTAIVLHVLVAHRLAKVDDVMAATAAKHAVALQLVLKALPHLPKKD